MPESGSKYDIIVVGAGVLGSAFAATFGKQGKRVLLLGKFLMAIQNKSDGDQEVCLVDLRRQNLQFSLSDKEVAATDPLSLTTCRSYTHNVVVFVIQ